MPPIQWLHRRRSFFSTCVSPSGLIAPCALMRTLPLPLLSHQLSFEGRLPVAEWSSCVSVLDRQHVGSRCGDPTDLVFRTQLLALAVLSSAARSPRASLTASSFAQKCMKNSRGCSFSMWL